MLKTITKIAKSRPFLILAGLFCAYLLFSYFAVNPLARRLVPYVAETRLASRASVEQVRFDPFGLSLTIDNLRLSSASGAPLAGFERLFVDFETSGLFRLAWRFEDIRLTAPQGVLDVAPDGKLNWADLLASLGPDKEQHRSDTIPRVLLDHILIERANIQYSERNREVPFKTALEPLGLELNSLSTLAEDRGDYQLVATLPQQGGMFKWKGNVGLNPVVSTGTVELQGVKLAELMRIVPPQSMPVRLDAGELQAGLEYSFAMIRGTDKPVPEVTLKNIALNLNGIKGQLRHAAGSELGLQQLKLSLPQLNFSMQQGAQLTWQGLQLALKEAALRLDNAPLLMVPEAQASGVDFDLAAGSLKVAEVLLADGVVQVRRQAGGSVDWQRLFTPAPATAVAPAAAKSDTRPFRFDIAGIRLKHWQADLADASFKHPLGLNLQDMNLGFALSNASGAITIRELEGQFGSFTLKSAQSPQPVASMAGLRVQGGEVDLKDSSVKLQTITLSGLKTSVLREAGKPLNWQTLLEPAAPASVPAPTATRPGAQPATTSSDPGWKVGLARIALEDGAVHFEDRSTASPVALDIQSAAFEIRDSSLDLTKALPVNAQFKLKQGGQFHAEGKLALSPLKADLKLRLKALALKPFSPYVNQVALLKLDDGSASVDGRLALKSGKTLITQFQGGFSIDNLAVNEEGSNATFISWKSLGSDSLTLGLNPDQLHIDALRIVQPVGKIIIHEDKTINIQRILRAQATPAQPKPTPLAGKGAMHDDAGAAKSEFPLAVERVKIENGDLEFADLSLVPQFGTHINTLSGVINGLSTRPDTTAQVELDGKVDEYGSARIRGAIQPFRATEFTDLKLAFHNIEMNRLTPYSGKFAGHKIESGKMSVDLEYNIKNRQLAGENKFVINKIKLGEHVASPDAMNLPLDLAIAVLQDSDGIIDLDLPITGSLDDPQFSYGKIVWKAIVNVLGKIVTAPFRALGKLIGVNADKMEAVGFDAGSASLAPPEQEKLKTLAQALAKRPGLKLDIVPAYDPVADRAVIRETTIRRDVAQEMGLKLGPDENPGPIDLNNPKAQAVIRKLAWDRSPEAKNRSVLDKLKNYMDTSKPTDPAAYTAMLQQLQQGVSVSDQDLATLAEARAAAMRKALETAGMDSSRLGKSPAAAVAANGREVGVKMTLAVGK